MTSTDSHRYAEEIIHECSDAWERLITGKTQPGGVSLANVTNNSSPDRVDPSELSKIPQGTNEAPAPIDPSVDKWFFISGKSPSHSSEYTALTTGQVRPFNSLPSNDG